MSQERGSFRRKLFGGFDRTDVINYIESIAGQRNKFQTEAQQLAQEASEFRGKLDSLTNKLSDRDDRLAETSKDLDSARKELNDVWKDLRETMDELDTVKGQLDHSNKELAFKSEQYEKDLSAAQKALADAKEAEAQYIAAISNAHQIISDLRIKYDRTQLSAKAAADNFKRDFDTVSDNMSEISTAFTDAEAKFQQLLADADKEN